MKDWSFGALSLCWYHSSRDGEKRGLVWCNDPVYCAASVSIHEDRYYITTDGWVGMPNDAIKSLSNYMEEIVKQA